MLLRICAYFLLLIVSTACLDNVEFPNMGNQPPVVIPAPTMGLFPMTYTINENSNLTVSPVINSQLKTNLAVQTTATNGSVTCLSQTCQYIPNPNFHGSDSFSFIAVDSNNSQSTALTVNITVSYVYYPPTITIPSSINYYPSQNYKIDLNPYLSSAESLPMTCSVSNNDATVTITSGCVITINNSDQSDKNIIVHVSDGTSYSNTNLTLTQATFNRIAPSSFPITITVPAAIYDLYFVQIVSAYQTWEEAFCQTNKTSCHGTLFNVVRSSVAQSDYYNLSTCSYTYANYCDNMNNILQVNSGENWIFSSGDTIATTLWMGYVSGKITYYYSNKIDIIFNNNYLFSTNLTGPSYDYQSVLTHEIGHMLGLQHVTDGTSVMYPNFIYDTSKIILTSSDLALVRSMYPEMIKN